MPNLDGKIMRSLNLLVYRLWVLTLNKNYNLRDFSFIVKYEQFGLNSLMVYIKTHNVAFNFICLLT